MCNVIVQYIYAATSKFFEGMLPPPFCEGKTTYNIVLPTLWPRNSAHIGRRSTSTGLKKCT
jgi:hypothetical protein